MNPNRIRSKWAAVGAAIAVSLGAGGIGIGHATTSTGEKPIYLPIEPCRLADTRPAFQVGPRSAPLGPGETYDLSGWGSVGDCTLPSDTAGLALNVTPVDPTAPTFLTFFPAGVPLPTASNLNPTPGQPPTPNAVNVDLNASGVFSVYNLAGNVHVAIDVVGIYDDHTHDDRYYTEDEIDDLLAPTNATRSQVVSALEFFPRYGGAEYEPYSLNQPHARTFVDGSGGDAVLWAPLHLPDGARIVSVEFFHYDNGSLNLTFRLQKLEGLTVTTLAEAGSSGSSTAYQSVTDNTILNVGGADLVDDGAAYYVSAGTNSWASSPNASDVAIGHVVVTYNILE